MFTSTKDVSVSAALVLALAAGTAKSQSHEALVLVNPTSAQSLHVSNYYADARAIPTSGLAYFDPAPADFNEFVSTQVPALEGTIANHRNDDSIDYIILTPDAPYRFNAPGLVSDQCVAVTKFSLSGAYTLSKFTDVILAGTGSLLSNGYFDSNGQARAFESQTGWAGGNPGPASPGGKLYIGAALGYTGSLGNTKSEVLSLIDRSVAADGSFPNGTFYFLKTNDVNRSSPRDGLYTSAVNRITNAGGSAAFSDGPVLPPAGAVVSGAMTGAATLSIDSADMTFVNGAFADHLTSWAATFDNANQTKMSRWIAKGAICTFGTIQEPCNYPQKFPTAYIHSMYFDGLTIGEACLRSLGAVPFQGMMYGDPLGHAYTHIPVIDPGTIPTQPVSGNVTLSPTATTTNPNASIGTFEVYLDGILRDTQAAGQPLTVRTTFLDDGWHELRIVAIDDSLVASQGQWIGSLTSNNAGKALNITPPTTSTDRSGLIQVVTDANDQNVVESRLYHNDRVVAAIPGKGTLSTLGEIVGAGPARLRVEMDFADGTTARSMPYTVNVADANPPATTGSPTAFDFTKTVKPGQTYVLELPALFTGPLTEPTYQITSGPSQGTILGGSGPYRIIQADAGASGTDQVGFSITSNGNTDAATATIVFYDPDAQPCPADTNLDGILDAADFSFWVFAYNAGLTNIADLNGNSTLEPADFAAWIAAFNTGCDY